MLVNNLLMQYFWIKFILENDNNQELNQNRDIKSRNKIKSVNNKKRRLNFKNHSSLIGDVMLSIIIFD